MAGNSSPPIESLSKRFATAERSLRRPNGWSITFISSKSSLREIREDLPKSYYYELPKLAEGPLKDYPRIYAVALALIAHTDSRLETNTLRRFIAAYQTVVPLSIGEVWAVAISSSFGPRGKSAPARGFDR